MGNLVFQATLGGQVNLVGPNTASTYNINVPTVNGNLVTTGDTGTVTNTMCATSVYTAPGTIGSGTPNTGAFTTLAASSTVTLSGGTANGVAYLNGSKVVTSGSALVFDGTNLGLGVTPSAWASGSKAINVGAWGAISSNTTSGNLELTNNAYQSSNAGAFTYVNTQAATRYAQALGNHYWYNAASGTAGNAITFTTAMTLDTSGNLGLGVTPSAWTVGKVFQSGSANGAFLYGAGQQGILGVNAYYGSGGWTYGGTGYATSYEQSSSGTHKWNIAASGSAGGAISFTQAMTLDASGNLGIGATSISQSLQIDKTAAGAYINSTGQGTSSLFLAGTSGSASLTQFGGELRFNTGGTANTAGTGVTERARIDTSGNLLVGATSSSESVVGARLFANGVINSTLSGSTSGTSTLDVYSTGAGGFRFYVTMDGKVNAVSTTIAAISDQRLKENIRDLDFGLSEVLALKPRRFDWKEGKGADIKDAVGFIAQEFETVFPVSVGTSKAGDDGIEYKNICHEELIPTLVKAIQEQQAIIESLTARITALEA